MTNHVHSRWTAVGAASHDDEKFRRAVEQAELGGVADALFAAGCTIVADAPCTVRWMTLGDALGIATPATRRVLDAQVPADGWVLMVEIEAQGERNHE